MPRYFFDLLGEPDEEGTDLAEFSEAKVEAIRLMGAVLCDRAEVLVDGKDFQVVVRGQEGRPLARIKASITSVSSVPAPYLRPVERRQA